MTSGVDNISKHFRICSAGIQLPASKAHLMWNLDIVCLYSFVIYGPRNEYIYHTVLKLILIICKCILKVLGKLNAYFNK